MNELSWTEDQLSNIREAINAEIENSRLSHKIIPEIRIGASDRAVARDRYIYPDPNARQPGDERIDESFVDLGSDHQEDFSLTKLQTEDPDLSRVLVRARRAAQQLARGHDEMVFRTAIRDDLDAHAPAPGANPVPGYHNVVPICQDPVSGSSLYYGDGLAAATAAAIAALDSQGYRSGFVMIAGQDVYQYLHKRVPGAADLPINAVKGLLDDGPVHRSAVLPNDEALILSITGEEIDRAVAITPTLEFLRIGDSENREFRLYERLLPRFKQTYSAVLLRLAPSTTTRKDTRQQAK